MKRIKALGIAAPLVVVLFQVSCGGCSNPFTDDNTPKSLTILNYNVQNLFDDVSNGSEYYEFDPSRGEWTTELFHRKLLAISEVLLHTPRGGADVLVLQEVENLNAVETLRDHYLKGAGYRHIRITDTPDVAIQLACLSRFPIDSYRSHQVFLAGTPATRPVFECSLELGEVKMTLLINHWKSKSGGAEETEALRLASAAVVRRRVSELLEEHPGRDIVIAGDLNERTDEYLQVDGEYRTALMPVAELEGGTAGAPEGGSGSAIEGGAEGSGASLFLTGDRSEADGRRVFYSPWLGAGRSGENSSVPGSYMYGGEWEQIDHVLFGPRLYDGSGVEFAEFSVVAPEFTTGPDGAPFAFYRSTGTGYSDHFPLLVEFDIVKD